MNEALPLLPFGDNSQPDDPDVGQTSGDHQAGQALRVSQVTFMQMKASTFLVGKKGFNFEAMPIPVEGFLTQFKVRNQVKRLFEIWLPPTQDQDRAISLLGKINLG